MQLKKEQDLQIFFDSILQEKITPNQFYLMYCISKKQVPNSINVHAELRSLEVEGWYADNKLTDKAVNLINKFSGVSSQQKTGVSNVESYNNLFPKKKLPSGKFARTNTKNLESAFVWFFKNYEYTWDVILKATALYVDEYEKKNYMYMQTSQYFIRKQMSDKSWGSELANWCAAIESGEDISDDGYFKQNVV